MDPATLLQHLIEAGENFVRCRFRFTTAHGIEELHAAVNAELMKASPDGRLIGDECSLFVQALRLADRAYTFQDRARMSAFQRVIGALLPDVRVALDAALAARRRLVPSE